MSERTEQFIEFVRKLPEGPKLTAFRVEFARNIFELVAPFEAWEQDSHNRKVEQLAELEAQITRAVDSANALRAELGLDNRLHAVSGLPAEPVADPETATQADVAQRDPQLDDFRSRLQCADGGADGVDFEVPDDPDEF